MMFKGISIILFAALSFFLSSCTGPRVTDSQMTVFGDTIENINKMSLVQAMQLFSGKTMRLKASMPGVDHVAYFDHPMKYKWLPSHSSVELHRWELRQKSQRYQFCEDDIWHNKTLAVTVYRNPKQMSCSDLAYFAERVLELENGDILKLWNETAIAIPNGQNFTLQQLKEIVNKN